MELQDQGIFVRLISLPFGVEGITTPNNDDTYNVYINENLSDIKKRLALDHELNHIKMGHLFINENIAGIEAAAKG